MLQDEISSRVWVCTSTHSSTKVMVLDASQPSDLLDSFYACNTHVVCIASVPGRFSYCRVCLCRLDFVVFVPHLCRIVYFPGFLFPGVLETDYPAGEEVPQDLEASQGDGVSLAGSVASVGSTGSDGAMAAEGITAIPQTAGSGVTDQATEQSGLSGSGTHRTNKTTGHLCRIHTYFLNCCVYRCYGGAKLFFFTLIHIFFYHVLKNTLNS